MSSFLFNRVGQYALVILAALTLNFILPRMMPGSPLAYLAGEDVGLLSVDDRAALAARYGLDRSLPEQYLIYLASMVTGNWGFSFQLGKPVIQAILERLPWTLLLVGTSLVLATLLGVALGALAAWRRGGWFDTTALSGSILLDSLPSFWLGMCLIAIFSVELRWFPIFGAISPWETRTGLAYWLDVGRHLVLPATTLTLSSLAGTFMVMRYAMLSVLGEDYIRTARSKGAGEANVLFKHATRNALLPVATLFLLNLGVLIGGATVIEVVFSYPGVGTLLYQAVLGRDYPLLQGAFFMITLSVVLANILADAVYPLLDPRVRTGSS